MSADEIRRLAEKLKPEEGCFVCNHEVLKPVHAALLAFSEMVERCDNVVEKFKDTVSPEMAEIGDYIRSGRRTRYDEFLRGDAGKEEK